MFRLDKFRSVRKFQNGRNFATKVTEFDAFSVIKITLSSDINETNECLCKQTNFESPVGIEVNSFDYRGGKTFSSL